MSARSYTRWTPERIATLRACREAGLSWDEIARRLGTTTGAVKNARWRFGLPKRRSHKRWTPRRRWDLMTLLEHGYNDQQAARKLGVSADAVRQARHRYGFAPAYQQHMTANQISQMLGTSSVYVSRWIRRGWLRATKLRRGRYGVYQVTYEDLVAFLENRRYWSLWRVEDITDDSLRWHARWVREAA